MTKKDIVKSNQDLKQENKWASEIECVVDSAIDLYDQFNKDLKCTDISEIAFKLYIYRKNNLSLYYKLLLNHFNVLTCKDKETKLINLGKLTLKPEENSLETLFNELDNINENYTQLYPFQPIDQKNKWNMLQGYEYIKPEKPEFDKYAVDKMINDDQFLRFAFNVLVQTKEYDDALKVVYDKYIKEDTTLLTQLSIYESYLMSINENINDSYINQIEEILNIYDVDLKEIEKIKTYIYSEITKLIETNVGFVEITLESFDNIVASELYEMFKDENKNIVNKFETSGITYNEIITSLDDYNISVKEEISKNLKTIFNIGDRSVELLLIVMSSLEITTLLYIDDETTITILYFTIITIIFKEYFKFTI